MFGFLFKFMLATASVFAFAMLDRARKTVVFISSLGGAITFTAEYFLLKISENVFLVYFLSASAVCLYSEIMARVKKIPVTVIMLPGIIPLVPGSLIYYSMRGLLSGDMVAYSENIVEVLLSTGGIASAAALVGALAVLYKRAVYVFLLRVKRHVG